ncbi:type II secretion system F family protein [Vibrio sp. JC009]|uniref:type II secretion system F family protein n=1 Tax=Vibrio sp. JC009 TaxID=2912314 RepID=UPI0023B06B92|nr:type II secretion system F family protein [Vibrio sp. JC009]WED21545.1 type II secretion system F family protein [Vibrio sp. JC009]
MASFKYQGRNSDGSKITGNVEAPTEELAAEALIGKGIIPVSITPGRGAESDSAFDLTKFLTPTIPLEVLVIFCRQMYSLTKAGVPLLRAIKGLTDNSHNKLLKKALEDVGSELSNGRSLSASMRRHSNVFSPLFVSMINVGENTGRLDDVLFQLAQYYENELETRKRIKSAMRYPTFVILFVVGALFILNVKVIPQFASMFSRFGVDLPLPTRILIATSNFFVDYWVWMIVAMVLAFIGFRTWVSGLAGREAWDKFRLRVPIVGDIVNRAQLARFSRTFALMLRSGVPLNQSIALSAESMDNKFLELRLMEMKNAIEAGGSVSGTAVNTGIFTPLVIQMIAVGEETGRIDELLLEAADFYDREVDYDLKTLTARIEPILLVIVAGIVLVLALGIFLPMWGMLDAIQG